MSWWMPGRAPEQGRLWSRFPDGSGGRRWRYVPLRALTKKGTLLLVARERGSVEERRRWPPEFGRPRARRSPRTLGRRCEADIAGSSPTGRRIARPASGPNARPSPETSGRGRDLHLVGHPPSPAHRPGTVHDQLRGRLRQFSPNGRDWVATARVGRPASRCARAPPRQPRQVHDLVSAPSGQPLR